ncbi:hypothetical protein GVAV_000475 [Gurleya vavrai]
MVSYKQKEKNFPSVKDLIKKFEPVDEIPVLSIERVKDIFNTKAANINHVFVSKNENEVKSKVLISLDYKNKNADQLIPSNVKLTVKNNSIIKGNGILNKNQINNHKTNISQDLGNSFNNKKAIKLFLKDFSNDEKIRINTILQTRILAGAYIDYVDNKENEVCNDEIQYINLEKCRKFYKEEVYFEDLEKLLRSIIKDLKKNNCKSNDRRKGDFFNIICKDEMEKLFFNNLDTAIWQDIDQEIVNGQEDSDFVLYLEKLFDTCYMNNLYDEIYNLVLSNYNPIHSKIEKNDFVYIKINEIYKIETVNNHYLLPPSIFVLKKKRFVGSKKYLKNKKELFHIESKLSIDELIRRDRKKHFVFCCLRIKKRSPVKGIKKIWSCIKGVFS